MNYLNTEKDDVLLGSGYLYAIAADKFTSDISTDEMTEIGYILDNAVFTRSQEAKEITTANYGTIGTVNGIYTTEFDTNIISYNAENIANFLTGSEIVKSDTGETMYLAEDDKMPEVALVFVGHDEGTGNKFSLFMPKCKWQGEFQLDFNVEDPVALNYKFRCLNTTMPNGKVGAGWIITESVTV